jgi:hypothetical protein
VTDSARLSLDDDGPTRLPWKAMLAGGLGVSFVCFVLGAAVLDATSIATVTTLRGCDGGAAFGFLLFAIGGLGAILSRLAFDLRYPMEVHFDPLRGAVCMAAPGAVLLVCLPAALGCGFARTLVDGGVLAGPVVGVSAIALAAAAAAGVGAGVACSIRLQVRLDDVVQAWEQARR